MPKARLHQCMTCPSEKNKSEDFSGSKIDDVKKYIKQWYDITLEKAEITLPKKLRVKTIKEIWLLNNCTIKTIKKAKIWKMSLKDISLLLVNEYYSNNIWTLTEFKDISKEQLIEIFKNNFYNWNGLIVRKFLFEQILDEKIEDLFFLKNIYYDETSDRIFSEILKNESLNFIEEMHKINNVTKNTNDVLILFNIIYWQIGYKTKDISEILKNSIEIFDNFSWRWYIWAKLNDAIFYCVNENTDINIKNIESYIKEYVYLPKFLRKNPERPDIVNEFTEETIKVVWWDLGPWINMNLARALYWDIKNSPFYKKHPYISNLINKLDESKFVKYILEKAHNIDDIIVNIKKYFIKKLRNLVINSQTFDDLSKTYTEKNMGNKSDFNTILSQANNDHWTTTKNKKNNSKTRVFVKWEIQANTVWWIIWKIAFYSKSKTLIALTKSNISFLLGYWTVKVTTYALSSVWRISDTMKRSNMINHKNNWHNFKFSPELLHFFVKNYKQITILEKELENKDETNIEEYKNLQFEFQKLLAKQIKFMGRWIKKKESKKSIKNKTKI